VIEHKKDKFNLIYPYIFTFVFLILSILLMRNHEIWFDEMRAWNIGSGSESISELINNLRASEGHPYLWSALLYFLSHYIIDNPVVMQALHLTISTITAFLILKFAPFNKIIKVMTVFSYFFFYEYSIISRNYSIGILFIVIFCVLYKNKYKNFIPLSLVLFAAGQSNLYSFIISLTLFGYLLVEILLEGKNIWNKLRKVDLIVGIIIIFISIILMYWQLGSQLRSTSTAPPLSAILTSFSINDLGKVLLNIPVATIKSFLPIPEFTFHFWETNLIINFLSNINYIFIYIFGFILFIVPVFFLKKRVLVIYIATNLFISVIPALVWAGSLRHYGHHFIIFIVCIWISKSNSKIDHLLDTKISFRSKLLQWFLIICLIFALIGTGVAYYYDYKYPFSMSKNISEYINNEFDMEDLVVIGYTFHPAEVVAGYLGKDIYHPYSMKTDKFGKFVSYPYMYRGYDINLPIYSGYEFLLEGKDVLLIVSELSANDREILSNNNFKEIENINLKSIISWENCSLYIFDKLIVPISESDWRNFKDNWQALNECKFIISGNDILIDTLGEDPYFESEFDFNTNNSILIGLYNIAVEVPNELRVYYSKNEIYTEEQMVSYQVSPETNDIIIIIDNSKDVAIRNIRIDPVNSNIDFKLSRIKIVELREVSTN